MTRTRDREAGLKQAFHKKGTAGDGDLGDILAEANDGHELILRDLVRLGKLVRMDRAMILGASRGLGAELVKVAASVGYPTVGFGRKEPLLHKLRDQYPLFEYVVADFSTAAGQETALAALRGSTFNKIFYLAGGGPYGPFGEQNWRSHEWAWEVTFKFPARILHALSSNHRYEQVVLVGSSVAENSGDPGAASYAASKHAIKGLYSSIRLDYPDWDVRLFSPGYMDTSLLPSSAPQRKLGVYDPLIIAEELWTWSLSADNGGHRVYPKHPS